MTLRPLPAGLVAAAALVALAALPARAQPRASDRLAACLPAAYEGFRRLPLQRLGPPDHLVALAFLRGAEAINLNASTPANLRFARAQYRLLGTARSEVAAGGAVHLRGLQVQGIPAQRTWYVSTRKSEVGMIVGGRVNLTVSLQPAAGEDAVLPYAEAVDLACLARAARAR